MGSRAIPRTAEKVRRPRHSRGFSLLEIMIALAVIGLLLLAAMSVMSSSSRLNQSNREQTIAHNAVRAALDNARNREFSRIFALYNGDQADDPDGPGTAPGDRFPVEGLVALPGAPNGMAGRIEFPVQGGALREDLADAALEMPHDLNGDGAIDAADHRSDYTILPVTVTVEWRSVQGPTKFVYRTRFTSR